MDVKIYLYPELVTLRTLRFTASQLIAEVRHYGAGLIPVPWDGQLSSLPEDEHVIVTAAKDLRLSWRTLAHYCFKKGHLLIYERYLVTRDGNVTTRGIPFAVIRFLSQFPGYMGTRR